MPILKARIRENKEFKKSPVLVVLLDHIPHPDNMTYELKKFRGNRVMYRSLAANGLVLYGIYNPDDPRGFGGGVVRVRDTNGEVHEFRGPWNSRASVMNKYFDRLPHITQVLVTDNKKHFERGFLSSAYAMEISELNKWLSAEKMGWLFVPSHYEYAPDEPSYELQKVKKLETKIPHELHP